MPGDALALLSGLLLSLSFPKFGHAFFAWVALAPLLIALFRAPGGWAAARLGYVTGASAAVGILYWTSLVVVQYGGLSLPLGIGVMLLLCLAVAVFPALFAWSTARACRVLGTRGLLVAPFVWVGTEILRAYTFFRFPWCLLGYSQHEQLPVIQIASVTGVYGVSFVVALASSVLAFVAVEASRTARRTALSALAGVLALVTGTGLVALGRPVAESGRVRAALVQASITQLDKWDPGKELENLEVHLRLSREAAAQGATFLVWPESAVPFYFDHSPPIAEKLRGFTRETQTTLLFGNDDVLDRPPDPPQLWVGAKMLGPDGTLLYRYHKNRLVPFGEYVPMKPVLTLGGRFAARLVRNVADFVPGHEATTGTVDGHGVGTSICYEAIFPDFVRQFSRNGAELLVNVTNDGWYGTTSAPYQHFSMAAFRAVENRKWLLRAANTGISAFVDPRGRVVARTGLFEKRALPGDAIFVPGLTFYARFGDVFGWTCLALAALTVQWSFWRRFAR